MRGWKSEIRRNFICDIRLGIAAWGSLGEGLANQLSQDRRDFHWTGREQEDRPSDWVGKSGFSSDTRINWLGELSRLTSLRDKNDM